MPHQLVNDGLASPNKAEAAHLVKASSKPISLAFLVGTAVPPRRLKIFWGTSGKWDRKKQLAKIKFCCTNVYVRHWKMSSMDASEQGVQMDGIAICLKYHWARKPS
jgi:hypothetical protein